MAAQCSICSICGRRFGDQHSLSTHFGKIHSKKRIYADISSYFCEQCGVLVDGSSRKRHESLHEETKGDVALGEVDMDYRFGSMESDISRGVVCRGQIEGAGDEGFLSDRTLGMFGDLCITYNLSHRLGNAFLKFIQSPLTDPSLLPRDMRTVMKRYDQLNAKYTNTDPDLFLASADVTMFTLSSFPGFEDGDTVPFFNFSIAAGIRSVMKNTRKNDIFFTHAAPLDSSLAPPHTANAWRRHEEYIKLRWGPEAIFGAVMLYADETTTRTMRGKTYYPVVLTLANNSLKHRCTRRGKFVVAFLPALSCPATITNKTERGKFGLKKLELLHKCWDILLAELAAIEGKGGLYCFLKGEYILVVPRLLLVIGDHPELAKMSCCKEGHSSLLPCRVCLVPQHRQHEFFSRADAFPLRTVAAHREFEEELLQLQSQAHTITAIRQLSTDKGYRAVRCAFLQVDFRSETGIHGASPSDLLHMVYLGMVQDVVILSTEILYNALGKDDALFAESCDRGGSGCLTE